MSAKRSCNTRYAASRQRGLSLVELMVSLAIGAMLIGGIIQIFTSNNAAFRTQQSVARIQENARFAFHFLTTELRQAGYSGCAAAAKNTNVLDVSAGDDYSFLYNFNKSIEGFYLAEETVPDSLQNMDPQPMADTDLVVIRRSGESQVSAAEDQPSDNAANFKVSEEHNLEKGDILTISNCQTSWTFQATKADQENFTVVANKGNKTDPGNSEKVTQSDLGPDFTVSKSLATIFYVGENPDGEPALYRKVNDDAAEELVSGIEDLRIQYGVDEDMKFADKTDPSCPIQKPGGAGDGQVDTYKDAHTIDDGNCEWARVIGARVAFLVRSQSDEAMPDGQEFVFFDDDNPVKKDDGRLRHMVSTTISFRNKAR